MTRIEAKKTENKKKMINSATTLIFTYGTLKRGFSNHPLLHDMISTGDASFRGIYRTSNNLPLVCGPYRVPFLLNLPGSGDHSVQGELYAVSSKALARMDELEGTTRGHYERLPITLVSPDHAAADDEEEELVEVEVEAEAYYAHRSYAEEMWKRNGRKGYVSYTKEVAEGYVYRKDRPPNLSFLDHIRIFLSSQDDDKHESHVNLSPPPPPPLLHGARDQEIVC